MAFFENEAVKIIHQSGGQAYADTNCPAGIGVIWIYTIILIHNTFYNFFFFSILHDRLPICVLVVFIFFMSILLLSIINKYINFVSYLLVNCTSWLWSLEGINVLHLLVHQIFYQFLGYIGLVIYSLSILKKYYFQIAIYYNSIIELLIKSYIPNLCSWIYYVRQFKKNTTELKL